LGEPHTRIGWLNRRTNASGALEKGPQGKGGKGPGEDGGMVLPHVEKKVNSSGRAKGHQRSWGRASPQGGEAGLLSAFKRI